MLTKYCTTKQTPLKWVLFGLLLLNLIVSFIHTANGFKEGKKMAFEEPNTGYIYHVTSYHVVSMTADSTHRSMIKVSRQQTRLPYSRPENIQTINFHPTLVDFDLDCLPTHCYLVAVTGRTQRNVELYSWQRTQFDLLSKRDSFAIPHAIKLFHLKSKSDFYIAIAQEQLQLAPNQHLSVPEYEEQTRFIGCAILKFNKGRENNLKYHQYIKLPFNPKHVSHYSKVVNQQLPNRPLENHYLVFSIEPNWNEVGSTQAASFMWSPLNDYFWPHKFPWGIQIVKPPKAIYPSIEFPSELPADNQTKPVDPVEPVEFCFNQLQRLLTDRDQYAMKLIDSSRSLWRSSQHRLYDKSDDGFATIKARVYVRGNVIVRGSMIESPQISLIGSQTPTVNITINKAELISLVDAHSPAIVEDQIRKALIKLKQMRNKLNRAVPANFFNELMTFNSPIHFYGPIRANRVTFKNSGIANSNVRLNGIPFSELQHNLIKLRGEQTITPRVIFHGKVTADLLEIHGLINGAYRLRDAIDITSKHVQMIDFVTPIRGAASVAWDFYSVSCPELVMTPNATLNTIHLNQFITKENRTQFIYGRKSFRRLSLGQLSLARPGIHLNGHDLSRIALKGVRLRDPFGNQLIQRLDGKMQTFSKPIITKRLIFNNFINNHINISSLIHDSVKILGLGPQLISGHKHFLNGLSIAHLTTLGSINRIQISDIFNLNPLPPVHNYADLSGSDLLLRGPPITGNFRFRSPVIIDGNLNAGEVNRINISYRAIRRVPLSKFNSSHLNQPQRVSGFKIFYRPLRVSKYIGLLKPNQLSSIPYGSRNPNPLVNNMDISLINRGIKRQMDQPPTIYVTNLVIKGNLHLRTPWNVTESPRTLYGKYSSCPLNIFKTRSILQGYEDQLIEAPVTVESLRVRAALLEPGAFEGLNFPDDFVLRSNQDHVDRPEYVHGHKNFEQLLMVPPSPSIIPMTNYELGEYFNMKTGQNLRPIPTVIFGSASSINNITYGELQDFVSHERLKNSTGERIFRTLDVYGNIYAKKINGYSWPDDIQLKSVGSNIGTVSPPYLHRRIYSPLIFQEPSHLEVLNQLALNGPVKLNGLLNSVNLTEFTKQSVTLGDKDLLSMVRPLRNKVFLGGLSVTGEIRSQGLIDGIDMTVMRNRVVTIGPSRDVVHIPSPKVFLSDVDFLAPVTMFFVNNLPIDIYLKRVRLVPGNQIQVLGKTIITGTMRINKNLFVQGPINKVDFVDLQAKAISVATTANDLQFNKTFTIEGDVFIDNLLIDEKNGTLDGVKLINLLPINSVPSSEMVIYGPSVVMHNTTQGGHIMKVTGVVNDCKITCSLEQTVYKPASSMNRPSFPGSRTEPHRLEPLMLLPQSLIPFYPSRPVQYNGRNVTYTRTTPPYVTELHLPDPEVVRASRPPVMKQAIYPDQRRVVQSLALRRPVAIQYEKTNPIKRYIPPVDSPTVNRQLDNLRKQIVSLNLNRLPSFSDLVVGFIEATSNDIGNLQITERPHPHSGHIAYPKSFIELDQIDFPFRPTMYHLSVGISTTDRGQNETTVLSSLGGSEINQLSVLPIESPNSAMFLVAEHHTLFLLISQDVTVYTNRNIGAQCPRYMNLPSTGIMDYGQNNVNPVMMGGIHVYLFHALQNSSSLRLAYFDLYQTIDLPAIDSFENFNYHGSTYALAISRATNRVYLLLLRGYSGFQIVSHIQTPMVDQVKVLFTVDRKPILLIYQNNGSDRLMEPVII